MKKILLSMMLAGFIFLPFFSYSQFTVSAELRPRFEMDNGKLKPRPDSVGAGYYVTQRTRLRFDYNQEKYQMRLTLQDVRFWGSGDIYSSTGVFASSGGVDIQEAWFRLKIAKKHHLTVGRQVLKLDDQRLIAGRNWNQYGISYDALSYRFFNNSWDVNAALSYNNNIKLASGKESIENEFFNKSNLMKSLNYLHVKRAFSKKFSLSLMAVLAGYQHSDNASVIYLMATYGTYMKFNSKWFDFSAEMYFQHGKAQSGKDVEAYMMSLHPGLKIDKIRIGIGGDYISGDNKLANNAETGEYLEKERTFNQMYGAVFKYYGYMNYYSYMKASTANGGLIDFYPNIKLPINEKHILTAFYHKFWLANEVLVNNEVIDNLDLGSEVDLMYTYKMMKEVMIQAGASYYFTTTSLEKVKRVSGTDTVSPYWVWAMITFTPELFKTK